MPLPHYRKPINGLQEALRVRGLNLYGVVTPTTLAANTNDYDANGNDNFGVDVIRLASSVAINLTGLRGGTPAGQKRIVIENVGTFPITLIDESTSSLAQNRLAMIGDITLDPDAGATLVYDPISLRWRAESRLGLIAPSRPKTGATIYLGFPQNNFHSVSTIALSANQARYALFALQHTITVSKLYAEVTSAVASSNIRIGLYNVSDADWTVGTLIVDSGNISSASTGVKTFATTQTLTPGRYMTVINTGHTPTMREFRGGLGWVNPAMGATPFIGNLTVTQTFGAFPSPGTAWTADDAASSAGRHIVLLEWS